MKTADSMFEELGYRKYYENEYEIQFRNSIWQIIFLKIPKKISISNILTMQELKAINEKCKELRMDINKQEHEEKIKELEKERDGIYADYQDLGKAYYDSIPKQVIKELKEKIHNTLDKNGITRGYQLKIDEYFDELLKEDI